MASSKDCLRDCASCQKSRQDAELHRQTRQETIYDVQQSQQEAKGHGQSQQEAKDHGQPQRKRNMKDSLSGWEMWTVSAGCKNLQISVYPVFALFSYFFLQMNSLSLSLMNAVLTLSVKKMADFPTISYRLSNFVI